MAKAKSPSLASKTIETLTTKSFLFRGLEQDPLLSDLDPDVLVSEKLYSNRPVYTAFRPYTWQEYLYVVVDGGPVIMRSTPLDRILALTYPGGCFGMRSLPVGVGSATRAFPSLVESYKTTNVVKVPVQVVQDLYDQNFAIATPCCLSCAKSFSTTCSIAAPTRPRPWRRYCGP